MVTTVGKWGNSLALRIPRGYAEQAGLEEDTPVEITLDGERIVIAPARKQWTLGVLVRGITESNRCREADWGESAGREVW